MLGTGVGMASVWTGWKAEIGSPKRRGVYFRSKLSHE
jgi:hypothetical protein